MIKKIKNSWYLYSKDGTKKLGGPYVSRSEAERREQQVNFFKSKK